MQTDISCSASYVTVNMTLLASAADCRAAAAMLHHSTETTKTVYLGKDSNQCWPRQQTKLLTSR